ncbi:hypothetical protein EW026_g4189 [Hermanssonia centrifuga]|uniref:Uncharacterized protein n=1 Tax=Hermanssonia centrifuga TaxID=98765 RepID=A0A4S4KIX1_9APHY|nr:hypothetical protein EW026_g4189 [Hermanssonia centrifuga]
MSFKQSFVAFAVLAAAAVVNCAELQFYTTRSCAGGASQDYQNVACNSCIDPPLDWYAVQFSGLGSGNRVDIYNEDACAESAQVGQAYGDLCFVAGQTAIRSAYVAC